MLAKSSQFTPAAVPRKATNTELTSRPMLLCLLAQLASQMRDDMVLAAPRDSAPDALPLPILNLGLPKSASETMYDFFTCSGVKTSHYRCGAAGAAGQPVPKSTVEPRASASKIAKDCRADEICNCKIFAECSDGRTPEPTDRYPLHAPDHYCMVYGLCGNDLPEHLQPTGWSPQSEAQSTSISCGQCITLPNLDPTPHLSLPLTLPLPI